MSEVSKTIYSTDTDSDTDTDNWETISASFEDEDLGRLHDMFEVTVKALEGEGAEVGDERLEFIKAQWTEETPEGKLRRYLSQRCSIVALQIRERKLSQQVLELEEEIQILRELFENK